MFCFSCEKAREWRTGCFGMGFLRWLFFFFLPSNRIMCKNNPYDALALCKWSCNERGDLTVHSCVALRIIVALHSNAVEVHTSVEPHVLFRWSYLDTEEWGPSFGFEATALNWISLNIAYIWPKFGDCFIKSLWIRVCVCVCALQFVVPQQNCCPG